MITEELVRFWRECDLDQPPYWHPKDRLARARVQTGVNCYADYVSKFSEIQRSPTKLHLSLLPQPYHGDLDNAEVIILLKNPGLHPADYIAEEKEPEFRQSIVDTIRQDVRSHMFLDPKWAWTSGFTWWESKLRAVGRLIAQHKFNGDYSKALACLARRIACLELVPYHSVSFGGTTQIESANAVRRFAREASKDRKIVVTRAVNDWDVGGPPNVINYTAGQARGASLGPKSPGGREILKRYGICSS